MSIKYLPRSFVDNFSGVLVLLAWGYAGYALGEWLVLITGLLFFILLVILVFIELYKNHRPVFESLTLGILLFILFVLVFAQADL